jgi:hypothetical protein
MKAGFRLLASVFAFGLLAACANAPAPTPKADIGFVGVPLKLDIADARLDNRYRPPGDAPNVEQLHTVTPSTVASRWLETRIVPVGGRGDAVLTVYDASVVEKKLATKGGLTGFFGDQVDTKLVGTLRAELVVTRPGDQTGALATYKAGVTAKAERTILESANLNERDKAYYDLLQSLASEFDRVLSAEINRSMGAVLR